MKRTLIIFLLAVLVTGLSWFASELSLQPILPMCRNLMFKRGWPLSFYCKGLKGYPPIGRPEVVRENWGAWFGISRQQLVLAIDLLFWFLVLMAGWWVIRKLKIKNEKLKTRSG